MDRLSIFDKNGPYLATKKVGKNNPKAAEIKADNETRMEWNRAVDRAVVNGVPEAEILELKKTEITDRVKESVEQNGSKPELFGNIVRAAVALLERLIAKVMQKVIGKAATVEETPEEMPKESESHIQAEDEPIHQPEVKKLPFPFDHYRKAETQNQTEQPPPSVLAAKYPRLKEIDDKLKEQNRAIFEREQKRDKLQKELSECVGIFKSGRRKELQQEIDRTDKQISNMKKYLSSIVREYKFDSVQAFYKEFNAAKKEYLAYHAARAEWKKIHGNKGAVPMSIRDRLKQKEQMVKIREAGRHHQTRQNRFHFPFGEGK